MTSRCFCVLVLSILCFHVVDAQLHEHPINLRDDLPSRYVTDIDRDSTGYIWIATYGGLCRYDGSHVRIFRHHPDDINSLSSDRINAVVYDHNNTCLWIASQHGLDKFDLRTYQTLGFHGDTVALAVQSLDLTNDGLLWHTLNGYGIALVDTRTDNYLQFPLPEALMNLDATRMGNLISIIADQNRSDCVWVGSSGGLLSFEPSSRHFQLHRFMTGDALEMLHYNEIRGIYPAADQSLYLGTWSRGLLRYVPIPGSDANVVEVQNYTILTDHGINPPLLPRDQNAFWVNSVDGNCVFDISTQALKSCFRQTNQTGRSVGTSLQLIDQAGRAWASSEYGVYLYDPVHAQFENFKFPPGEEQFFYVGGKLLELPDGDILTTYETGQGVYHFNGATESFNLIPPMPGDPNAQPLFNGEAMIETSDGTVLIIERKKLYQYVPGARYLKPLDSPLDELNVLWKSAIQSSDGTIWLGTERSGLAQYNSQSQQIKFYHDELKEPGSARPGSIDYLLEDKSGNIWMRMANGYTVYERATSTFHHIASLHNRAFTTTNFSMDKMGNVWFGAAGIGLCIWYHDQQTFHPGLVLGSDAGITRLDFKAVAIGTDSMFWMITGAGLQSYNAVNGQVLQYGSKDGLLTYDPDFHRNPMLLTEIKTLSNQNIAFAPRAGLTLFDPATLVVNREIPRPYLLSVTFGDSTVYDPDIQQLRFPYRTNPLVFQFSSLAFTQSAHLSYEYRLDHSSEWTRADAGTLTFNALEPGSKQLTYRAINSAGKLSEARDLQFDIVPPWWRTGWFYALLAIVIAGVITTLIGWRYRHLRTVREQANEIKLLMSSLESRALRSQMNPHFLFNIFNTIQELILTGDNDMAYRYTAKFSKLLRMIMSHASREELTIEDESHFLELYLQLESLRFDDAFTYSIEIEEGLEQMLIPVFMIQPLVENAIRHGLLPKKGNHKTVTIQFASTPEAIVCQVRDNGLGLDPDRKQRYDSDREHAIDLINKRLKHLSLGSLVVENAIDGPGVLATLKIEQLS